MADQRDGTPRPRVVTGSHGRVALRNAGFLLIQRGGLIAAGFLFATVVPRLMGPELYGRYSLVLSLTTLFVASSALGFTEVVGRHEPGLRAKPDPTDLRRRFGNAQVDTLRALLIDFVQHHGGGAELAARRSRASGPS